MNPWCRNRGCCNIWYPSETHIKQTIATISLPLNYFTVAQSFSTFYTEQGNDTALVCAAFQYNYTAEIYIMDVRVLARSELRVSFRGYSILQQDPVSDRNPFTGISCLSLFRTIAPTHHKTKHIPGLQMYQAKQFVSSWMDKSYILLFKAFQYDDIAMYFAANRAGLFLSLVARCTGI